jgi:hypothetical protein
MATSRILRWQENCTVFAPGFASILFVDFQMYEGVRVKGNAGQPLSSEIPTSVCRSSPDVEKATEKWSKIFSASLRENSGEVGPCPRFNAEWKWHGSGGSSFAMAANIQPVFLLIRGQSLCFSFIGEF